MNNYVRYSTIVLLLLLGAVTAFAQIRTPSSSPGAKLMTTVGLTDVTVEYSRPGVKGRTIFAADGLVPYGEVWRTGANSATKITFSDDVKVAGKELKAGSYAILTTPSATEWKVMMYPYESTNWSSYVEKEPAATVMAKPEKIGGQVETFTFDIGNITNDAATIELMWENTKVSLPLSVDVDKRVMADIERVMAGPSANDYYAAASYLYESNKELDRAHDFIKKANGMGDARFWMVRREAQILAAMGKKRDAIEVAKKSMKLAQEAGNDDYVRMNEKSIKEWSMSDK